MTSQFPQVLAGRYEIRDLIGRGGMAEVHLGYDTRLSRVVAIKLLRSDIAGDPTFQARFRREAQSSASLNHPSIVAVYPTADWHERETYDMFGIVFDGHPALARILMPDDWPGHPQRKDYPLGGIPVEYKGAVVPPPDERRSYS